MRRRIGFLLLLVMSFMASAADPPAKPEAAAAAEKAEEFKIPRGFRAKKRGDATVYCRKETPLGSRFQTEKCYDEAGLRQLQLADLEKTEMLERIRACGTSSCSAN
jgi:hypothetical protein